MGTFTLKQIGATTDLFLIPNANGCNIDLTPVGEANNWECTDDPIATPDEDTTYVHSDATNLKYDLYNAPNHTTESGTINYVQVFARAKSQTIGQHEDGVYKILITDDACANIYKSNDIDLTASTYRTYDKIWTVNPRTSVAFTWDDIDNMQFGLECSSPSVAAPFITTFRPNAAGDVTQLTPLGDAPNWKCVDEESKDDMATVVRMNYIDYPGYEQTLYDLYHLTNHTTENGAISKIVIFAWVYANDSYSGKAVTVMKTGGNTYYGTNPTQGEKHWILISTEYIQNPATSSAWTWDNIDDLQAGIRLNEPYEIHGHTVCTQLYVAVYHTEDTSLDIRTTQCYAKVNHDVNIECTLDKPEEISIDHDQNIKMLNFWSGDREVYGLSRNNRTMVMTGKLYSNTACTTITCIEQLGLAGNPISLSGLGSNNFDKVVRIISFGWQKISDSPLAYKWILECEFAK